MISCDNDLKVDVREKIQQDIAEEVMGMIANRTCNGSGECASIAWGINPCGSANEFLVYAPSQLDQQRLQALVLEYNQLDREIHELNGVVGVDCDVFLIEPKIECQENHCTSLGERYVVIN
jgi:hypothetical protein